MADEIAVYTRAQFEASADDGVAQSTTLRGSQTDRVVERTSRARRRALRPAAQADEPVRWALNALWRAR
jgi:hypothetical protein